MAEEALGTSFKRLCAHYSRMRCWRILSGLRGARPNKIVCRIRRLRRIRPILRLRFPRHSRVVFIFGGGNPRRAKQRQTGEEVEKCHQPQHGTKCCARGGFSSTMAGCRSSRFNHFKTNSSQKCSANQGFFARTVARQPARRSRRKADSWRRWKSPGQSIATSVSATQCCSGAGR
ncbi:Uncharacterised protein [Escherichia coli]|nr:Uncharacterised protein [Escherichia coli]